MPWTRIDISSNHRFWWDKTIAVFFFSFFRLIYKYLYHGEISWTVALRQEYFQKHRVLAFDEAHVLNIGDALLIKALVREPALPISFVISGV